MTDLLVVLAVFVAVALAAPRYGVDSRPGAVGERHTVRADLRAGLALLGRARRRRPALRDGCAAGSVGRRTG